MKALRAILIVLAFAVAAYLAFRGMRTEPAKPAEPPAPAERDPNATSPFDVFGTPSEPPAAGQAAPAAPPAAPNVDVTLVGTPASPAAEISLVVPYRTGTKCRYRVMDAELRKNRDTEEVWWGRYVWTVSTEVVKGDGSGAARIRFQIDSFKYHTDAPGRRIEVDSEHPDRKLIDDPAFGLARGMKPWLAVCGMPVEFVLDEGGVVRRIEGLESLNRKYLDVVSTFGAQQVQDADDAPTLENMIEKWGQCLFPPLGGGKLKGSASRDAEFRTTYVDSWCAVSTGKLRATHDDRDAFRAEFKGTPAMVEVTKSFVRPKFAAVEKAKVITSADSFVAAWRFDRAAGRLLASRTTWKYCLVVASRAGADEMGRPQYDHPYIDLERRIDVELLDP
jgi:hypothetical protein